MTSVEILEGKNIKVGDTDGTLRAKLLDRGAAHNLQGKTVDIKMRRTDSDTLKVDSTATIEQEPRGIVQYSWSSSETDTSGTFLLEFVVTDGSGDELTFPDTGYARVYIEDRL